MAGAAVQYGLAVAGEEERKNRRAAGNSCTVPLHGSLVLSLCLLHLPDALWECAATIATPGVTHSCPCSASRCRRLSALYRYNTDVDGSLDFSSWAAFTASALEVGLAEWRQGRAGVLNGPEAAGFQVSKAGLLPQLNAEPAPLPPSLLFTPLYGRLRS